MVMFDKDQGICTVRVACKMQRPLRSALLRIYYELESHPPTAECFIKLPPNIKCGDTIRPSPKSSNAKSKLCWQFEEECREKDQYSFILVQRSNSKGGILLSWSKRWTEDLVIPIVRINIPISTTEVNLVARLVQDALLKYLCDLADPCVTCGEALQSMAEGGAAFHTGD